MEKIGRKCKRGDEWKAEKEGEKEGKMRQNRDEQGAERYRLTQKCIPKIPKNTTIHC